MPAAAYEALFIEGRAGVGRTMAGWEISAQLPVLRLCAVPQPVEQLCEGRRLAKAGKGRLVDPSVFAEFFGLKTDTGPLGEVDRVEEP
jgi:hypothetical protein